MKAPRPYVLSIAGFDPSAGAGVLSDVKTMEANKVYGLGVVSGNTFQDEDSFHRVDWISLDHILEQVSLLTKKYRIGFAKIGLIENIEVLHSLADELCRHIPVLVWDPILQSSSGFSFHDYFENEKLHSILKKIHLLTPNTEEAKKLSGQHDADEAGRELSLFCNVYLKGGHRDTEVGKDILFLKGGKQFTFRPPTGSIYPKHGSGCVLSSAITANLARGYTLQRACLRGKQYTAHFLSSSKSLLGYHKL
jgi:hydroxymethylpyrimidine/phosphomethylpyrimidine kinase